MSELVPCSARALKFIQDAVSVAQYVGVDALLFRPGLVSGVGGVSGMAVVLLHTHNENLPFDGMGVSQPSELATRLSLVPMNDDSVRVEIVDGKMDDDPTPRKLAAKLYLKNGRMKITHSTGNPKAIKAPKRINFQEAHAVLIDRNVIINSLASATKALNIDNDTLVAMSALNGEIHIQVTDKNNDSYEDVVGSCPSASAFSYRYTLKHFTTLIKGHQAGIPISASKDGVLKLSVSEFDVFLLPKQV